MVPNDDNRLEDARDMRKRFYKGRATKLMFREGISVLEVIVALSRRCAFNGGNEPEWWAQKLLENLGLLEMTNPLSRGQKERIDEILYALIWRQYEKNGSGGFFPLKEHVAEDQTEVEIWYQMSAYIRENHLI